MAACGRQVVVCALLLGLARHGWSKEQSSAPAGPQRERFEHADVFYDWVTNSRGDKLRTFVTRPRGSAGKVPAVFFVGWLSCDSVEYPNGETDGFGALIRRIIDQSSYATVRVEKPGVGESRGTRCEQADFQSELEGYQAGFDAMKKFEFIDPSRIFVVGISNGGGFAPLVPETDAEQARVRGFVSVGGWVKTWLEHMFEIERRRFTLSGKTAADVNDRMKTAAFLYPEWLVKGRTIEEIARERPAAGEIWPEGSDRTHLYGRPLAFYQQLQKLNLSAAWSRVKVPTLLMHGQYDWIMTREDPRMIAAIINANKADAARFVEQPETGHTFQHYKSLNDAFEGREGAFDPAVARVLVDWFQQQRPSVPPPGTPPATP